MDSTAQSNAPYWHIAELSGTPFLQGEGGDHGIDISGGTRVTDGITTGYTIISIPVKEQYLNNTLTIQCGLCSAKEVCYNTDANRLSENITSSITLGIIKLVSFG